MKQFYLAFLTIISLLFSNIIFAQCDGVTMSSLTNPGPFQVATMTESNGIRNGPLYNGATIYYPVNATPPFASIAIVPGFTAAPASVQEWGPFYASHGIVAIIIGTNSPLDFPETRANALLDALETIKQENTRAASPLLGALNLNQLAVSGWSMGGGGAQRAAVLDPTIAGVVALCPYLLNPQLNHQSPTLIFSGQSDPTAIPALHADLHYNAIPATTDKMLFEFANGNHSVANTPTGGSGAAGRLALAWLKLYVEGNDCYCSLLSGVIAENTTVSSKILQSFECELLGLHKIDSSIALYPNPTRNIINLEINDDVNYEVFSPLGKRVLQGKLTGNNKQIDLSQLPASMYFLNLGGKTFKVIKYN